MAANMDQKKPTTTNRRGIGLNSLGRSTEQLSLADETMTLATENLNLYYGEKQALFNIDMSVPRQKVTAFIGPSGCGKSTLLRCFNRMNDLVDECRISGQVLLDNDNIYRSGIDVANLRRRVGMVFQKPKRILLVLTRDISGHVHLLINLMLLAIHSS